MTNPKVKNIVEGFWQYLKKSHHLSLLPDIMRELTHKMNEIGDLATVYSGHTLSDDQEEKITKILDLNFGVKHVQFKVDQSLLGGIKVRIGDEVLDLSLQSKLESLTKSI